MRNGCIIHHAAMSIHPSKSSSFILSSIWRKNENKGDVCKKAIKESCGANGRIGEYRLLRIGRSIKEMRCCIDPDARITERLKKAVCFENS